MHSRPRPTKPPRYPILSGNGKYQRKVSFPNLLPLQQQPLLQNDPSALLSPSTSFSSPNALQIQTPEESRSHPNAPPRTPWVIPRSLSSAAPVILIFVLLAVVLTPLIVHVPPLLSLNNPNLSTLSPRASPQPGVAIIAACTNRHPMLARAFVSWLRVTLARQIILIDWSSSPPLSETIDGLIAVNSPTLSNITLPDIKVVRVQGESNWVLTRAYNLAASLTKYSTLVKVDCDVVLGPNTILFHALPKNPPTFFSGHPSLARDENELYLSGQFVTSRSLFLAVGGYDERIQTYGYEDTDLYNRLEAYGAVRLNLSYEHMTHVVHHDTTRSQAGVAIPLVQVDINDQLLQQLNDSWTPNHKRSQYQWGISEGDYDVVRATTIPSDLSQLVSDQVLQRARVFAFSDHLHREYFLPTAIVESLPQPMREKLIRNLILTREYAGLDRVQHPDDVPSVVVIHVQNGIGNRLRVLGSGLAFAAATDREPIVIWERDEHFGAIFPEIFNQSSAWFAVIDEFSASWPLSSLRKDDETWERMVLVNYMLKEDVGTQIEDIEGKNIYFKSSAIMNTPLTSWESENESILRLRFTDEILGIVDNALNNIDVNKLAGVHIRNRSLDEDMPGVEDNRKFYYKDDMDLIDKWRALTKVSSFVPTMRKLLKNGTTDGYFVASDTIDVCKDLKSSFDDGAIHFLDRDCDDRGPHCLRYAVADILLLAKTDPLLGSSWSSFTEAAMRLGAPKALLAGLLYHFISRPSHPSHMIYIY